MPADTQPTLLGALWRFRVMAAFIVAAAVALSLIVGLAVSAPAQASGTVALTTPPPDAVVTPGTQSEASLARFTAQRARFATSDVVITDAAEALGIEDLDDLRDRVSASPSGTSNTIEITATADDGDDAVRIVGAVIESYRAETEAEFSRLTDAAVESIQDTQAAIVESLGDEPSDTQATSAAATIGQLRLDVSDLLTTRAVYGDGVDFSDQPRESGAGASSVPLREALLGLIVGLAVAGTAAWLRADRDAGIDSAQDVEAALQVPNLGLLRERHELQLLSPLDLDATPTNSYRLVWTALRRKMPAGVIMVASTGVDARSIAAINLATAAARDNRSVLLVDADLRTSQISYALSAGDQRVAGLRGVLGGDGDWHQKTYRPDPSGLPSLTFLPAGIQDPGSNVSTEDIETMVTAWRSAFDLVIVDADDVSADPIAATLYGAADAALVIVGQGVETDRVRELQSQIAIQGTELVGGVFAAPS